MKSSSEVKQNVKEKHGQIAKEQKVSSCCGPTCCSSSNENRKNQKKEK
ncbi:MAG: hypothetical protein IH618_13355 [Ignavibacteriaceae bacterium]|nr:hypothetical protein [Ignavibacteriaceae bacterium]